MKKFSMEGHNAGDYLSFYVISPIKRVIGFGIIKNKFIDESLIWPDELLFARSMWKYRIKFEKLYVVNRWSKGIPLQQNIMLNVGRKLIDREVFLSLVRQGDYKWKTNLANIVNIIQ